MSAGSGHDPIVPRIPSDIRPSPTVFIGVALDGVPDGLTSAIESCRVDHMVTEKNDTV
ncbi:hypothetical protein Acsp03_14660 [Actinomadura sp. NBRC 104412]|nr:hypothetical protein Acsp03_14660 [Actinomadura sp. NBRC 104412]